MILPPATLGLLGGGQLGRFFVMAAHELGYRVIVLDPDHDSPAGRIADEHLVAGYDDLSALGHLAKSCAAVTTERARATRCRGGGRLPESEYREGLPEASRFSAFTLCRHPQRG